MCQQENDTKARGGLDLRRAMQIVDGDRDLLQTLMELFVGQFAALEQELRVAFAGADLAVAAQKIHQLAGAALSIGAQRLGVLAQELERACRTPATALPTHLNAPPEADVFLHELSAVLREIRAFLAASTQIERAER